MAHLRRMVSRVALVLVSCQAASLSIPAATLWPGPIPVRLDCTCTHGEHAACPMHHGRTTGSKRCAIGNAAQAPTAALTSILDMGLLSTHGVTVVGAIAPSFVHVRTSLHSLRPQPPDPPPPRA